MPVAINDVTDNHVLLEINNGILIDIELSDYGKKLGKAFKATSLTVPLGDPRTIAKVTVCIPFAGGDVLELSSDQKPHVLTL